MDMDSQYNACVGRNGSDSRHRGFDFLHAALFLNNGIVKNPNCLVDAIIYPCLNLYHVGTELTLKHILLRFKVEIKHTHNIKELLQEVETNEKLLDMKNTFPEKNQKEIEDLFKEINFMINLFGENDKGIGLRYFDEDRYTGKVDHIDTKDLLTHGINLNELSERVNDMIDEYCSG